MDTIALPLLQDSDSTADALAAMRRHGRGAVVRQTGLSFDLLTPGDLFGAMQRKRKALAEVDPSEQLYMGQPADLVGRGASLVVPRSTEGAYEGILDDAGFRKYGLLAASADMAIVFSRNEPGLDDFREGPANCHCTNCGKAAPGGRGGDKCRRCGQNKVYCLPGE